MVTGTNAKTVNCFRILIPEPAFEERRSEYGRERPGVRSSSH